jgi:hypothetical protein
MVSRSVTYVPGLYKIFDEILVNAADNKVSPPSPRGELWVLLHSSSKTTPA